MPRRPYVLVALTVFLRVTGCALVAPSKVYDNPNHAVGGSDEGATVHFIRSGGLWAGAVAVRVFLDGEPLLRMRTKSYVTLAIKPGRYNMMTDGAATRENVFSEWVSFSPSETYHVLFSPGFYGPSELSQHIRFKFIKRAHALELMEEFQMIPTE